LTPDPGQEPEIILEQQPIVNKFAEAFAAQFELSQKQQQNERAEERKAARVSCLPLSNVCESDGGIKLKFFQKI